MSRRRSIKWPSPGPFERLSLAGIWLDCVASLCSFLETDSTQARLRSATQAAIVSIGWRLRCHRAMHSAAWARRARAARGDRRSRRGVGCTPPHARSRVASAVRSSVVSKTGLSRVRSGRRARQRSRRMWCRAPPRRTLSPSRRASRPSPHGGLLRAGTRLIKYKLANATRDNTIDSLDAIL
jgi:hypothetical protein